MITSCALKRNTLSKWSTKNPPGIMYFMEFNKIYWDFSKISNSMKIYKMSGIYDFHENHVLGRQGLRNPTFPCRFLGILHGGGRQAQKAVFAKMC